MGIGGFGGGTGTGTTTKKASGIGGFAGGGGAPKKAGGGPSLDDVKKAGGAGLSLVGKALQVLDLPRAVLLAEGRQLGGALQGKGFNADEMLRQIKEHEGFGELVENAALPINVKRAIGFVGDVATDPLTYMTAGIGTGVKAIGLKAVEEGAEAGAKKAVRITAEQAARELDESGARAAANKVLRRHSVNALTAEEAAGLGVRQGPTIGLAGKRVAIPGGDRAARGVSNALAPLTEKLHEVIPLRGRVSEAAKGLEPIAALRLKDAEQAARLTAKGMADAHLAELNKVLKAGDIDAQSVREALEGTGPNNPVAVQLRSILDSVAARTEELTGRRVPRIEHYLPHRLTAEAKAELANAARSGKRGTAAVMSRAYKAGDKFLGEELVDGSIDELNRIAGDKGFEQLFKDDPIQLVHAYINEMKAYAQRAGVPMRLSTDDVITKVVGAPGSRAAKKAAKGIENQIAALGTDLEGRLSKASLMDPAKHLAQADELERRASALAAPPVPAGAAESAASQVIDRGGFTIQPRTGAVPETGFAVAIRGAEQAFPPPSTPEELAGIIDDYMRQHADDFNDESSHLGGWVDEEEGKLYLDVTRILPDHGAAEKFGREQGQLAYFDLAKKQEVRLPREAPKPSLGGSQGGVGNGAGAVPVAAPVTAGPEFRAAADKLRGQLEDVEKKLKSNAKELRNPKLGNAAKGIFERRSAELEARKAAVLDQVRVLQAKVRDEGGVRVVQEAPAFDHAVAATNPEAAAVQAAENLQKLEALRAANVQRATEKRLAEVAARERAGAMYAEAQKLRAIGQDEKAIIAHLHAQVVKTEADFNKLDGELGKLRALANRKRVVVDGKAMADAGLRQLADGRYAEPWVAGAVTKLEEALKPESVGKLLKTFDRVSSFWRASALLSPGFHERNFFGGMFNNHLAGMDTKRYFDFAVANRQFKRGGLEAVEDKGVRDAMESAMRLGQYEGADISDVAALGRGEGGRKVGTQNPLFRANIKAGQVVERNLRMPLFIDTFIKTGGNEQAALDAVMTYHFDYEDLSRFERVVTRRTFAFYTWTRKNLPLQLHNMLDQPGKYTAYLHLKRNVELGTPEDEVVPSFFERQLAIRLPFMASGGRVYAMPELPFINASEALGVEQIAASLNPVIKTPLEALTNHKFFEQRNFKSTQEATPNTWAPILQVLRLAGGKFGLPRVYKASDGTLMMSEHEAAKIESLIPVLARMRRLAPSEQKYQDRALTSWLSFAFGVSARTLDEVTIGGEVLRRQAQLNRQSALHAQLAGGAELAAQRAAEAIKKRQQAGQ